MQEYIGIMGCSTSSMLCDITKTKRKALALEKTHYNDAFVIAGGGNQKRIEPIYFEQVRRNNRSLGKFYDAKYIDIRTGKPATGQELFNGRRIRDKNYSTENLRKFRGQRLSKGQRRIRTRGLCQNGQASPFLSPIAEKTPVLCR